MSSAGFWGKMAGRFSNRCRDLERELRGATDLIQRQADLLTGVVNAVRGDPPPDMLHSHHDAVELVTELVLENHRLRCAIETLVADEVISAGRARELHRMTIEEQRLHWRRMLREET